jgi:TRAP-type C4-dicarboxylate transport system permease small subunit
MPRGWSRKSAIEAPACRRDPVAAPAVGAREEGLGVTSAFLRVCDIYGRVLRVFAVLAGIAAFAIMWLIDINAFSRKLMNAPLPAGVELTQALLPAVIVLPFGYALMQRQHVRSVFLVSRLSRRAARWLQVFWMLVGFVLFALVTWGTFRYALRSYLMNEQVWGADFRFPLWPSKMAVSLGSALICLQFLLEAMRGFLVAPDADGDGPDMPDGGRSAV